MIRLAAPALLFLAAAAPPVPSPTYDRAIAAGYKALTVCNGVFAAERTPERIDAEELAGTYPEYQPLVGAMRADLDRAARTVSVAFAADLPPRVAAWDGEDGCQLDPIGSPGGAFLSPQPAERTPDAPLPADPRAWPLGDAGIAPRPSRALASAVDAAFADAGGTRTTGVVVLHGGKVVAERYAAGWGPLVANRTWSVAKSIAGTLVGLTRVDPALPAPVPEWLGPADPRAAITLDHLLRMASGLHGDTAGNRTDAVYFGGVAVSEQAGGFVMEVKPGTRFRYANTDILLAVRAVRATRGGVEVTPRRSLFVPLGMAHTWAGTDRLGDYILSSQVWSTARDLARLGQFWLQDGVWQGRRLLPAGWMRYMTTPSGPQPADAPGYGATLWLFGPDEGLPAGSYAAQGNRGQFVMVVPAERLVVVRRGEDPGAARFDIAAFTARVIAATK